MNQEQEVRQALMDAKEFTAFQTSIEHKHAVVFLGLPYSGKSTLINYILGNRLRASEVRRNQYKVEKMDESEGPCVNHGMVSGSIPKAYPLSPDTILVDTPGFEDHGVQKIINGIFVKLLQCTELCKFVLVCDINGFAHNQVENFVNFVTKVEELIPNFGNSASLIVTKDNSEYTQSEIAELLRAQVLGLPAQLRERFINRTELIGSFRMPNNEGEITREVDINIHGAISNSAPLSMGTVPIRVTIPSQTRTIVSNTYREFLNQLRLKDELNEGLARYTGDFILASYDNELDRAESVLTDWKNTLSSGIIPATIWNVQRILQYLSNFDLNTESNCYKTLALFVMLEKVGLTDIPLHSSLIQKYNKSLQETIEEVAMVIGKIRKEKQNRRNAGVIFNGVEVDDGNARVAYAGLFAYLGLLLSQKVRVSLVALMGGIGIAASILNMVAIVLVVITIAIGFFRLFTHLEVRRVRLDVRRNVRQQQGRV